MNLLNFFKTKRAIHKVNDNPFLIRNIDNPSIRLQLAAVHSNIYSIKNIENPCIEAQRFAVTRDINCVGLINNISEEVLSYAVSQKPSIIKQVKNPPEKILDQLAIQNPEIYSEYVIDNMTLERLKSINPSIEQQVCKQSHHTLYDALCTKKENFHNVSMTSEQFKDLYYFHLKNGNKNYLLHTNTKERNLTDNNIANFLKGRVIDVDSQFEIINDRIGNYSKLEKPDITVTARVLELLSGIKDFEKAEIENLEKPLKTLVSKLEIAYIRANRPCLTAQETSEISMYREQHGDIDEYEFAQIKSDNMMYNAYKCFINETGVELKPENITLFIQKEFEGKGYKPDNMNYPFVATMNKFYLKCLTAMTGAENNVKNELKKISSLIGINELSQEQRKDLLTKGTIDIPGKGKINKVKDVLGYSYKTYSYTNQSLANVNNMNRQGSAEF